MDGKLVVMTHRRRPVKLAHLQLYKTWCIFLAWGEERQPTARGDMTYIIIIIIIIIMLWTLRIKPLS
jgi:hypothetical protein